MAAGSSAPELATSIIGVFVAKVSMYFTFNIHSILVNFLTSFFVRFLSGCILLLFITFGYLWNNQIPMLFKIINSLWISTTFYVFWIIYFSVFIYLFNIKYFITFHFVFQNDIGLGTVVGSAVYNILFVISLCALFAGAVSIIYFLFLNLSFSEKNCLLG